MQLVVCVAEAEQLQRRVHRVAHALQVASDKCDPVVKE